MEAASSSGRKRSAKGSESTSKKSKTMEVSPARKLNQDIIDKLQSPGPKSRRSKQHFHRKDQLEDRFKGVGDVWTKVRGYELFLFHFLRKDIEMLICNLWITNLGKLVVPNVFVNIRLMEVLVKKYNSVKRCIQFPNGEVFIRFIHGTIDEVFSLDPNPDVPLSFEELEEEFVKMDTTYKGWNLDFHRVQKGILTKEDGPPFNMDIFRHYLQYTYMSCR